MMSELTDLARCKKIIEQKLDWGPSNTWVSADFDNLQQRILDETGVSLSASTLRRIWGRVDYQHMPSGTTLNTLAQYAGYADWRQFIRVQETTSKPLSTAESVPVIPEKRIVNWRRLGWMVSGAIGIVLLGVVAFDQKRAQETAAHYSFSSKPLTRTIPNSVIFTYDASASPTDSVYIQQSWDQIRRDVVSKNGHTHTSIYYEPGFYRAKLIVGHQIVQEHSLLIPTNGWLGLIDTKSVPIYLKPTDFIKPNQLQLTVAAIQEKNVALQPEAPRIKYYNVGNFDPVSIRDFTFNCDIKNTYNEGSAACQLSWIALMTKDMPITIPLSTKGCVSELMLMNGTRTISGKNTDLSGLGVDFTDWVHVACHSDGKKLYYSVNQKVVYSANLPTQSNSIIGIVYGFRGTGAVKEVSLRTKDKLVFQAF